MKRFFIIFILMTAVVFSQQSKLKIAGGFGEVYFAPVYSPDGSMLAFTSENYKGIWIYSFSDGTTEQLTDEDAGFGFSWSQDSKNILTRAARFEDMKRFNAVKIFDVGTGESQNLSGYKTFMPVLPQWSSDNSKIFTYTRQVEVYNSGKTAVKGKAEKSAIIMNNKIAVGDIPSGEFKTYQPFKDVDYINMSLSPDGSKIVFEIVGGNIYKINSDGSGLVDLGKGFRPKWSFDSKSVVYMISEDDGHVITSSDIYMINPDGSGKKQITDTPDFIEMNPSFSPDGKKIAFHELTDGAIYIINID